MRYVYLIKNLDRTKVFSSLKKAKAEIERIINLMGMMRDYTVFNVDDDLVVYDHISNNIDKQFFILKERVH